MYISPRDGAHTAHPVVLRDPRPFRGFGRVAWLALGLCLIAACSSGDDDGAPAAAGSAVIGADLSCPPDVPMFRSGPAGIGLEVPSASKAVTVRVVDAQPLTPAKYENSWTVQFLDAAGAPLNDVAIQNACAWMYVHNHGGAAMSVTQLADRSMYKITDLNLFMRGPWSIELAITPPNATGTPTQTTRCAQTTPAMDKVTIQTCVPDDSQ